MKISKMEAFLLCVHCHDETPHVIIYINGEINSIKCKNCNHLHKIKIDVKKEVLKEIYNRISTKPSRITEEYKEDLNKFLLGLPIRIIKKPYRLIRDLNDWRKFFKTFND